MFAEVAINTSTSKAVFWIFVLKMYFSGARSVTVGGTEEKDVHDLSFSIVGFIDFGSPWTLSPPFGSWSETSCFSLR